MVEIIFYIFLFSLFGASVFFQLREFIRITKKTMDREEAAEMEKAKQKDFELSFYN